MKRARFYRWSHVWALWTGMVTTSMPLSGQLHLMTGSATPKDDISYASVLFRVEQNGKLQRVATLAAGTYWIGMSYDWRKIVLLSRYPDNQIKVVDFDKAAIVKRCNDLPSPIGGLVDQWLIDSPSKDPVFVEYLIGNDIDHGQLRGMVLDPSVPCDKSFVPIDPGELRFHVGSGMVGTLGIGGHDAMTAYIEKDGQLSAYAASVTSHFDPIPAALLADVRQPGGVFMVSNERALVVGVGDGAAPANQRLIFFRKSDRSWGRIPVSGEAHARGFGNFIAITEGLQKSELHRESAGRSEWRKARSASGPHIAGKLEESDVVYTGRLHLFNVENEKLYTIVTNQGDSEVLLVEGRDVYYRVSDRLYQASIMDTGISAGRLLVRAEEIRDVHWAFMKH